MSLIIDKITGTVPLFGRSWKFRSLWKKSRNFNCEIILLKGICQLLGWWKTSSQFWQRNENLIIGLYQTQYHLLAFFGISVFRRTVLSMIFLLKVLLQYRAVDWGLLDYFSECQTSNWQGIGKSPIFNFFARNSIEKLGRKKRDFRNSLKNFSRISLRPHSNHKR